jgi:hypothetical protein
MKRGLCIALVLAAGLALFPAVVEAGEIIKKTYYDSKGRAVGKYVYQAGSSRRSYARGSRERYPAYRPEYGHSGFVYSPAIYRAYRPVAFSRSAYHANWRTYCGYHGVTRQMGTRISLHSVSPLRVYPRR